MSIELHLLVWSVALAFVQMLVAVVTQRTNSVTAWGAQLFFWARLIYAAVYVAGIPWVRTAVWGVSVIGLLMIFSQVA